MQIWKAVAAFDVRSAADMQSKTNRIAERDDFTRLRMIGPPTDAPDGPWVKVRVYPPAGQTPFEGWARVVWLEALPISDVIDLALFTASCITAAMGQTSAHYLIALAHIESGIKNISSNSSSAFGPFQFLESTWNDYVHAEPGMALYDVDILDPLKQPDVAAKAAASGADTISRAIRRKPTYAETYFAHLFGRTGGSIILRSKPETLIKDTISSAYSDQGRVAQIIEKNKSLLQANGENTNLRQVIDEIARRLDEGFDRAQLLIENFLQSNAGAPDEVKPPVEVHPVGQDQLVPWMARAKAEIGVSEYSGARSNPRVEAYFRATRLGTRADDVAWCAAFVSWCIANCGSETIARQSLRSATAADWLGFGTDQSNPSYGTIVILKPLVKKSTGHVGFLTKIDNRSVTVLAGNQGNPDQVCEKTFPLASVQERGFRRPV